MSEIVFDVMMDAGSDKERQGLMQFAVFQLCDMVRDLREKYYGRPLAGRWE
jgi:hypothetical protein